MVRWKNKTSVLVFKFCNHISAVSFTLTELKQILQSVTLVEFEIKQWISVTISIIYLSLSKYLCSTCSNILRLPAITEYSYL